MIHIVPLTLAHCQVVAAVHELCFDHPWSDRAVKDVLSMPGAFGFMAVGDDLPLGFILCSCTEDEAEVLSIATVPDSRRTGIGKSLLAAACDRVGNRTMFLEVAVDNEAACTLYRKLGFIEVGRRKGYYKRGSATAVDALILQRAAS